MVLDKLGESLKNSLARIARAVFVDEKLINELIKDIQRALLQADVNVNLVFELTKKIKERALKEEPAKRLTKREHLINIVYEELTNFLGKETTKIEINGKPFKIMMVGLFGSGKCVHPKSLIPLTSGEILSAEDLYKRYSTKEKELLDGAEIINVEKDNLQVPSFNPKNLKIEDKKITHLWKLNGKELLNVYLDNGNDFSVRVTPEHPFFVLRNGKLEQVRADMLISDDSVAVPRYYNTNSSFVNLFSELKELDLEVSLSPLKAREAVLSHYTTIKEVWKNLKFKRNYCKLASGIKQGMVPIRFLNALDNCKIRLKNSSYSVSFPEYITTDLAEFLGYLIGDGHLGKNYIEITAQDKEVIDRVCYLSESLFSVKPSIRKDKRNKTFYAIIASKTLVEIFNRLFGIAVGKKGKELRVPAQLLRSDSRCITVFLRAYFDCEAYPSPDSREIEVSSESNALLKDVHLLLLRFGIISTISKKIVSQAPYWRLHIRARYAELYADKIGFFIASKSNKIKRYRYIGLKQGCGKQDLIPLSELLRESRAALGFSIGEVQGICNSYGRYEHFGIISRESLFKVKELYLKEKHGRHFSFLKDINSKIELKSNYSNPIINSLTSFYIREGLVNEEMGLTERGQALLQKTSVDNSSLIDYLSFLAESDVCWVKVTKIKMDKTPDFVYDLTVEDNHSFIADGIVVHNTTTIGKLARYYSKRGYKVAALGLDVHRPAAPEQLEQVSKQVHVPCMVDKKEKDALKIYKKYEGEFKKYDILIIDTAGRDALSKDLIREIKELNNLIKPDENLLVISADIGQAAQAQAEKFHESCGITGIIAAKMDGTAKAGGALTACAVTKAPIKFIGVGEKPEDIEEFKPANFVGRLLGMGDLEALLEKAKEAITAEEAEDLGKRFLKGDFNLIDLYEQMVAVKKMGSLSKLVEFIPGFGQLKLPKDLLQVQEGKLEKWRYAMNSMTKEELENPEILEKSRLERIAKGSGVAISDIRELLKQYKQSKKLIKSFKGAENPKQLEKMMKKFKGKLPM